MTLRHLPPTRDQELSVLRTIVYASLFDYPLTPGEICEGLIGTTATEDTVRAWLSSSSWLRARVEEIGGYWCPRGRADTIGTRRRRETSSRRRLQAHGPALRLVANLPFVRMVALSGSLAHLNASRGADVDLFLITAPGRVWAVTTTALLVARLLGWRRHLCLNYVVSERQLAVEPADLFTANQIVHLRPLIGLDVYRRFLEANPFVDRLYPNFEPRGEWPLVPPGRLRGWKPVIERVLNSLLAAPVYERACRVLYRWYLRRQAPRWRSRDQVRLEDECLKLHTTSHRAEVLARFEAAMADVVERANVAAGR